jgi:tRNA/rRNA methyltransferase
MVKTALAKVRIVLVEPAGPLNVGSIARAMKNMGLQTLVLVDPQCDHLSHEARQMAVHAADILESAQQVATLPEALAGCQRAIATTTRTRNLLTPLEHPRTALPWLLAESVTSALIFGPEDRGLNNLELNYAQRFVRIPSHPDYSSLNLAQAVAICAYELYQATGDRELGTEEVRRISSLTQNSNKTNDSNKTNNLKLSSQSPIPNPQPPTPSPEFQLLEGYYQHLEAVLLKIGYLYPHTAPSRMEKFRHLFNHANLSTAEIAMLRGILRQVEWALQSRPETAGSEYFQPEESLKGGGVSGDAEA